MSKILKVAAFVSYKDGILRVEKLGGMNDDFIFFNPEDKDGAENWKIQLAKKVFYRMESSNRMVSREDLESEYVIINSDGEEIGNSKDLNPEFVYSMLEMMRRKTMFEPDETYYC